MCIATYLGCYHGWYWIELHSELTAGFVPSPFITAVMWALGAMAGGAIAGLFAEVGTPLAAAIVPLPLAAGAVFLVGRIEGLPSEVLGWIIVDVVTILVGSGVGVLVGTSLRNQLSKAGAPGGIWWPHWLYFPIVAYYLPIYLINTATNIWIDLKLGFRFTFDIRTWFWWRAWVYGSFLSWFAGVPTYLILLGYNRLYEVIRIDSGHGSQKKFNAFFMYFLTVPAIAWILTFVWRWVIAELFSAY